MTWVQHPVTGKLIPKDEYVRPSNADFHIMPDIQDYKSVIDGSVITSRSRHREHLKRHDCVEVGTEKQKPKEIPPTPGVKRDLINICKQYGVLND
jgi:hypothetical protein